MPALSLPSKSTIPPFVKALLIGDSGTGKTGALASLVRDGFQLRVVDMDNKIQGGILPIVLKRDCPDKIGNVQFEAMRDKYKSSAMGPLLDGIPKAFTEALALLDKWSDGSDPKTWGAQTILVIDSLTFFADAAFNWAKAMNPSVKDPRQWYGTAQSAVESVIAQLTSSAFATNVIVISHVSWVNRPDGTMKGYPTAVGQALGPTIPAYFDNMILCETLAGKRTMRVTPTAMVDAKTPALGLSATMPIETGLADFFKVLRT